MIILAPSGPTQFDIQFMSISLSSVNDLHKAQPKLGFFIAEKSIVDDIKLFPFLYHLMVFLTYFSIEIPVSVTTRSGKSHLAVRRVCPWPCISLLPHFHLQSHSHTSNHFTFSLRGSVIKKFNLLRVRAPGGIQRELFHWFPFNHNEILGTLIRRLMMKAYRP